MIRRNLKLKRIKNLIESLDKEELKQLAFLLESNSSSISFEDVPDIVKNSLMEETKGCNEQMNNGLIDLEKDIDYYIIDNIYFAVPKKQEDWGNKMSIKADQGGVSYSHPSLGSKCFVSMDRNTFDNDTSHWKRHEIAHCQVAANPSLKIKKDPFNGLANPYPNNEDERYTFSEQFKEMLNAGYTKEDILREVEKEYSGKHGEAPEEYMEFFELLIDKIINETKSK